MNDALTPVLGARGPGGRDRLELLGPRRLPHRKRAAPVVQRPPPGHPDPIGVRPGGAALPTSLRFLPLRRRRLQPGLAARCGDRPQRLDRLGSDHQPSRRPGPLSGGGVCRTASVRVTASCRCAPSPRRSGSGVRTSRGRSPSGTPGTGRCCPTSVSSSNGWPSARRDHPIRCTRSPSAGSRWRPAGPWMRCWPSARRRTSRSSARRHR